MFMYRCDGNMVQIQEHGKIREVVLPGYLPDNRELRAHLSRDGRYIAFGSLTSAPAGSPAGAKRPEGVHGIWVYDLRMDRLMTVPHSVQETDVFWDIAFDAENRLYYSDGNTFWRWRLGAGGVEKLFRFQRVKGAPMGMEISPDGRYLSYYKFRADDQRFQLYDLETGENRDLRFSFYRYGWLDRDHVVWTKMGGLKVLDVKSGTSRTVLRDYRAILKRCGGDDAARIGGFLQEETIFEDLDLLGLHGGRLWFRLALRSFPGEVPGSLGCLKKKCPPLIHDGVWSVGPEGKAPRFHYETPKDCLHGHFSGFFRQGALYWIDRDDVLQSWNGVERRSFPAGWRPLLLPEDIQK